jgi:hypothetical protein
MYDLVLTREASRFYNRAEMPLVRRLNRCFHNYVKIHIAIQTLNGYAVLLPVTGVTVSVIGGSFMKWMMRMNALQFC